MNNPCYKCADRHFKCHAECEKYKAWLDDFHAKKEANEAERGARGYNVERRRRMESKIKKGSAKYKNYYKTKGVRRK